MLHTLKSHNKGDFPQYIKIASNRTMHMDRNLNNESIPFAYCPYMLLRKYLELRPDYINNEEQFFVFNDRSPVTANHFRNNLKIVLNLAGVQYYSYSSQSFRAGELVIW